MDTAAAASAKRFMEGDLSGVAASPTERPSAAVDAPKPVRENQPVERDASPLAGSACSVACDRLPALHDGRAPVGADRLGILHPRAELGLRELRVRLLEHDPVGVARLEVRDQDLARDLVLAAGRDVE